MRFSYNKLWKMLIDKNMKKSDLKYGNVVKLRNGYKYFVYLYHQKALIRLNDGEWINLISYREDLTDIDGDVEFDIMKVYKDYTLTELLWERKEPKLIEDEKVILRNLPKDYKWIARDKNGCLYVYASKPKKGIIMWESDGLPMIPFDHLFQFIQWKDDEPYSIEDLLKGEEK